MYLFILKLAVQLNIKALVVYSEVTHNTYRIKFRLVK